MRKESFLIFPERYFLKYPCKSYPWKHCFQLSGTLLMEFFTMNNFSVRAFDKVVHFALKIACIIVIVITCISRYYYLY